MRTPLAVILIVLALILGGVAGFLYAGSPAGKDLLARLPGREAPAPLPAAPVATNPFEQVQVNPLQGAGYDNPLEEVRFNPFE